MFPRHRGRSGAGRGLVLAALPLVLGTAVLLAGGDPLTPGSIRLETARSPLAGLWSDAAAPQTPPAPTPGAVETAAPATDRAAPAAAAQQPAVAGATPAQTAPVAGADAGTTQSVTRAGERATSTTAPAPTTSTIAVRAAEVTTTTSTTTPPPAPAGPARTAGVEAEVVPLTNRDRAAQGLVALTRNACLDAVASGYAEQLARSGVLAHNPGAGPAVTGCRADATWGDNVGTAEPCDTARLEREWMASPSHRRNILTGAFQLIGVGAWTDAQGGCWVQVLFST